MDLPKSITVEDGKAYKISYPDMKERILQGWNFRRVIYLVIGSYMVIQSIGLHEWMGILLGGYVASMAIFAFGCAGGNCGTDSYHAAERSGEIKPESVKYEEIQ